MVKVWCEWNMGFSNIDDNTSVFQTREEAIRVLDNVDWSEVEYNSWQEVQEDGLLSIEEVK